MKKGEVVNGMQAYVPDTVSQTPRYDLISSCRLQETPSHDVVHVWNRGGKSGTLTVNKGDGVEIIRKLLT